VRKQCSTLLKYTELQECITGALSAWMEDLLPAINILGNTELDNQVFTTTFHDYTTVEHLFLIPQVLEKIEGYMLDDSVQSDDVKASMGLDSTTCTKSELVASTLKE